MQTGICLFGAAAIRQHHDHKSEMVSQLLFGECARIVDGNKEWLQVKTVHDDYPGWVAKNQLHILDDDGFLQNGRHLVSTSSLTRITETTSGADFFISAGSSFYSDDGIIMTVNGKKFVYEGDLADAGMALTGYFRETKIPRYALLFLHTPYLWGGRSEFGIDCSGLTQVVYKMAGINISRDASKQAEKGEPIHLIHEALPGDLVFFDNEEGMITHAGIILENNRVIHAHGRVRIDLIDHQGIYDAEKQNYTHHLRLIKRF